MTAKRTRALSRLLLHYARRVTAESPSDVGPGGAVVVGVAVVVVVGVVVVVVVVVVVFGAGWT